MAVGGTLVHVLTGVDRPVRHLHRVAAVHGCGAGVLPQRRAADEQVDPASLVHGCGTVARRGGSGVDHRLGGGPRLRLADVVRAGRLPDGRSADHLVDALGVGGGQHRAVGQAVDGGHGLGSRGLGRRGPAGRRSAATAVGELPVPAHAMRVLALFPHADTGAVRERGRCYQGVPAQVSRWRDPLAIDVPHLHQRILLSDLELSLRGLDRDSAGEGVVQGLDVLVAGLAAEFEDFPEGELRRTLVVPSRRCLDSFREGQRLGHFLIVVAHPVPLLPGELDVRTVADHLLPHSDIGALVVSPVGAGRRGIDQPDGSGDQEDRKDG